MIKLGSCRVADVLGLNINDINNDDTIRWACMEVDDIAGPYLRMREPMSFNNKSEQAARFLGQRQIHEQWQSDYLNPALDRFYDAAFADIVATIKPKSSDKLLDAGCGYCYHTVRLARSEASITGVDFSEAALSIGRQRIADAGLSSRVHLDRGDLTDLPFEDGYFEFVLSWGVLMHIPNLEQALRELVRVLKPGGILILCENNANSLDVRVREPLIRGIKRLLGRKVSPIRKTPWGIEAWNEREDGGLMVRKTDLAALTKFLAGQGLNELSRSAGQFTEAYTNFGSRSVKKAIYALNMAYYKHIGWHLPAMGNIVLFQKNVGKFDL